MISKEWPEAEESPLFVSDFVVVSPKRHDVTESKLMFTPRISRDTKSSTNSDANREHLVQVVRMTTAVGSCVKQQREHISLAAEPTYLPWRMEYSKSTESNVFQATRASKTHSNWNGEFHYGPFPPDKSYYLPQEVGRTKAILSKYIPRLFL